MKGLYIYDTESDGLAGNSIATEDKMTKFHCLLFKEYKKDNWVLFLDYDHEEFAVAKEFAEAKGKNLTLKDIKEFNKWVGEEPEAIGCQNQFGFDLKAFKQVLGTTYSMFPENLNGKPLKLYDTLSMSRTLWPDRMLPYGCAGKIKNPNGGKAKTVGPHSLEAWGYKLANLKVSIEDWRGLPLWKYVDRVWEDVIINELQWEALIKEMSDGRDLGVSWKTALRNGMLTDYLMAEQEEQGVVFNEEKAWELLATVDTMMLEIAGDVEPRLPLKDVPLSRQPNFPKDPFSGDGSIGHHAWNYARNVLGYKLNEDYFTLKAPPKTSFKKDGSISKHGMNYCIKHGVLGTVFMGDFIREQSQKVETTLPLDSESLSKLTQQLKDKYIPPECLKEPMKLSNQEDIKEWLVTRGGWRPSLFNTKDVTRDDRKQQKKESDVEDSVWDYIQDKKDSIYEKFISKEMGFSLKGINNKAHRDFKKAVRKGRFLVTSPKLKDERGELCPNLERIDGAMAKQIVKWLSLRNRRAVIKSLDENKTTGWLNHPRLKIDGKLPARYNGLTNTFRRKHSVIANIPSGDALLAHEMRSLFTVPENHLQLGCDASNLENIVAAWWAWDKGRDNGDYYKIVSVGDPHSTNAVAYSAVAGREVSRGEGKGITYAILYGAGAPKVGTMLGVSKEVGKDAIAAFWDSNLGLKRTKEYLEKQWDSTGKKYIIGIDGRKVMARSKSSLLNLALQSTGAILMDLAGIKFKEKCVTQGIEDNGIARTIYYHDEYQIQVPEDQVRFKWFEDEEDCKQYIKAFNGNPDRKFTLAARVKEKDGKYGAGYCKAGELLIESIEEATAELGAPVVITGEYMLAWESEGWAGAH